MCNLRTILFTVPLHMHIKQRLRHKGFFANRTLPRKHTHMLFLVQRQRIPLQKRLSTLVAHKMSIPIVRIHVHPQRRRQFERFRTDLTRVFALLRVCGDV